MPLNEAKGDMYAWASHTLNFVKGRCPHSCRYCYVRRVGEQKPTYFDEIELQTDIGEGKFIFCGSSIDFWAEAIPREWIETGLLKCKLSPKNRWLWMSKNPKRFMDFLDFVNPSNTIFCTTIESDMDHIEGPPAIDERFNWICKVKSSGFPVAISIDPIMDFDENRLLEMINDIGPQWVSIGADSQGHGLPEPTPEKVRVLLSELGRNKKIEMVVKPNLGRLL
uniref:Radical SAM superfamily protein n=1 Tax=viral metagenome TaxID=1070528 RepID=A0A6M3LU32_9ZZZZ